MAATPLDRDRALALLEGLHPDWQIVDHRALLRRWKVADFSAAQAIAVIAGALAEQARHHPDLALGWGYCEVRLTSHDAGGLTERDFALARRLDGLLDG